GARWVFLQAEDGIRDRTVTGVQTCALPISMGDMGVRLVDLVRWTCGEFARVTAHAGIAYPTKPVAGTGRATDAEDYLSLVGELEIGRASCRERVQTTGGAGAETKIGKATAW